MTKPIHQTAVEEIGDDEHYAYCTCGWESTGWETREEAEYAAEEHERTED